MLPNEVWEQEEHGDRGGDREQEQPILGGLALDVLAQELGVVLPAGTMAASADRQRLW